MHKILFALLLFIGMALGSTLAESPKPPKPGAPTNNPPETPDAKAKAQAALLLETSDLYLDLGDREAAEARILEALKIAQSEGLTEAARDQIREDVKKHLEKTLKAKQAAADKTKADKATSDEKVRQKHLAQLQESEWLLSEGKVSEAAKIVQSVIGETDDAEVRKQALNISGKINSTPSRWLDTFSDHLSKIFWWVIDILLVSLLLYVIYLLLKWKRDRSAINHRHKWIMNPIEDTTGLGVAGAVVESLNRWNETRIPVSAGLLRLGMPQVHAAPSIDNQDMELDLASALQELKLDIGGVGIGGIAKAGASLRNWFRGLYPSISGSAAVSGEQVVVRLTRRGADGKRNTVTASADKSKSVDAAEAAGFKMYYLLATKTNASEAESANKLREGLNLLRDYLFGRGSEKLKAAYETFRDVHIESPSFNEAYLYEGIALDLLERHDDAIKLFHYLAEPRNISSEELRMKARYNEAVSLFRKYRPDSLKEAIQIFSDLTGPNPAPDLLAASPIKALAQAAKANAIAHKPIFWQDFLYPKAELTDQQTILQRKREKGAAVSGWVTEVEQITDMLEQVYMSVAGDSVVWDEVTRRQLKWAIENARGNVYLNYAKSFLNRPHLQGAEEEEKRPAYLEKAYEAFQNCEVILSPGVETLSNLATVLVKLSRGAEARTYLERAKTLNPQYEYAYYRIAQSWEKENRTDKVVEVLKDFAKDRTPAIPGFKSLYNKYSTELARP